MPKVSVSRFRETDIVYICLSDYVPAVRQRVVKKGPKGVKFPNDV